MVMFNLIKMLADGDVDFVLVGGLAVALHGYPRLTMDVENSTGTLIGYSSG